MTPGSMPGFGLINVIEVAGTALAAQEREAAERSVRYPALMGGGPAQFWLAAYDGRWRIVLGAESDPWDVRVGFASHLRRTGRRTRDPAVRAEMFRLATRLDPGLDRGRPARGNEWVVGGRRYRVVRGHEFVRWGADGPEPARVTDVDPADRHPERGFLLDPVAPTAPTEAALRLDLVNLVPEPGTVSAQTWLDARAALERYPGIVLLPLCYRAMELRDGDWTPVGQASGPGRAREALAGYFREILPRFPPPGWTADEVAEAVRTAGCPPGRITGDLVVAGHLFRIIRGVRMIRVGPDGPEPSRASDEPDLPDWWPAG
ncbi:DUF5954 family protein [Sphaerisporangium rufum]|nr:DUF5954 family protein [Sphaerisporangium rufum]